MLETLDKSATFSELNFDSIDTLKMLWQLEREFAIDRCGATMLETLLAEVLANPDDWQRYLIVADCYEEQGRDVLATTFRWMADQHKHPHKVQRNELFSNEGDVISKSYPWLWTTETGLREALPHAGLPKEVCRRIGFGEWRVYTTWEKAVISLAWGLNLHVSANDLSK
jgi:hypothetical protein